MGGNSLSLRSSPTQWPYIAFEYILTMIICTTNDLVDPIMWCASDLLRLTWKPEIADIATSLWLDEIRSSIGVGDKSQAFCYLFAIHRPRGISGSDWQQLVQSHSPFP